MPATTTRILTRPIPAMLAVFILCAIPACGDAQGKDDKAEAAREEKVMGAESDDIPLISLERVFKDIDFSYPLAITHAGDESGRLFVASREGKVTVFSEDQEAKDAVKPATFLDLTGKMSRMHNEEGLLALAFHPDYAENGELFVFYTAMTWKDAEAPKDWRNLKKRYSRLSRFTVDPKDPNRVDPDTEEVLLEVDQPWGNHNGGEICFGEDGYLYLSIGDGGAADDPKNSGQDRSSLLGSIIRINVDEAGEDKPYSIPEGNPFVDEDDMAPEIWAWGLRNVWRMSFDSETGDLWAGDVGQNAWEEVNIITKGGNYGWRWREGLHRFPKLGKDELQPKDLDYIDPVFEYERSKGTSITGGLVYRGDKIEGMAGIYFVADYQSGRIWGLRKNGDDELADHREIYAPGRGRPHVKIAGFGVSESGVLYICDFEPSKIHKIVLRDEE